jgi:hypothetical protein
MSMATAIEHLQESAAVDILAVALISSKGKAANPIVITNEAQLSVTQDDSGTTAGATAAGVSSGDKEGSIVFVNTEPDTTTAVVSFEGDGSDPAQPVPPRSTLDWLAYTVSLNYNRVSLIFHKAHVFKAISKQYGTCNKLTLSLSFLDLGPTKCSWQHQSSLL